MSDPHTHLHPEAIHGLRLLRAGEYFPAHEALENAWRAEPGPIRGLYQGLLQVAVIYYHLTNGNLPGAVKVYHRSRKWLDGLPEVCLGVEVGQLRRDLKALMGHVGQGDSIDLDRSLLKAVAWHEE